MLTHNVEIRKAILEGNIDRALKHTHVYYPRVFDENAQVHFKLCCRKFIEMVRKTAQLRSAIDSKMSNGHRPGSSSISQDMDVDVNGGDDMAWNEHTDFEADMENAQFELLKLEEEMLSYGQTLGATYARNPRIEVSKALEEIWALVAYSNPVVEPTVSHLLDKKGRVAVAEELNSAILGKCRYERNICLHQDLSLIHRQRPWANLHRHLLKSSMPKQVCYLKIFGRMVVQVHLSRYKMLWAASRPALDCSRIGTKDGLSHSSQPIRAILSHCVALMRRRSWRLAAFLFSFSLSS